MNDFVRSAFSTTDWLEGASEEAKELIQKDQFTRSPEACKKREYSHPIFNEFICRYNGLPKSNAVNKWDDRITIGIDWPRVEYRNWQTNDLHIASAFGLNPWGENNQHTYEILQSTIAEAIPVMERLTGLPVEFLEPSDPRETIRINQNIASADKEHARIRIVPTRIENGRYAVRKCQDNTAWITLKIGRRATRESCHPGAFTLEPFILGGFPFNSTTSQGLDGYYIPNADNSIGYAVCHVDPKFNEETMRAHVSECLLRSLGLPNEPRGRGRGSKKTYDLFLTSLLYCSNIKPGMILEDAREVASNDICIEEALEKIGGIND